MLEQRPTEPKPNNPWPGVIMWLSTMALFAWALWLLLG
jgi:hypothetical protein